MATLAESLAAMAQGACNSKDDQILNPTKDQIESDANRIYAALVGNCFVRASRGFKCISLDLVNPDLYSLQLAQSFFPNHRINNALLNDFAHFLARKFIDDGLKVDRKPNYGWILEVSWHSVEAT